MDTFYSIGALIAGVILLIVVIKIFTLPIKIAWKLLINALIGAVVLILVNLIGGIFGIQIPITWASAIITGLFGFPGVIALLIFRFLL